MAGTVARHGDSLLAGPHRLRIRQIASSRCWECFLMSSDRGQDLQVLATLDHYPAILRLFQGAAPGRILDVPSGHGAFAQELLKAGYSDIDCLDINADSFALRDPRVRFVQHDVANRLPYPDGHFDYRFSIEGIEH